jgi:hypothetical protein
VAMLLLGWGSPVKAAQSLYLLEHPSAGVGLRGLVHSVGLGMELLVGCKAWMGGWRAQP